MCLGGRVRSPLLFPRLWAGSGPQPFLPGLLLFLVMGEKPNFQAAIAMVGVADLHHRARAACFLHPDLGPGWDPGSSLKFERFPGF